MTRFLLLLGGLLLAGCGDSSVYCQVSGQVQADGQPVDDGTIVFTPVNAGPDQRAVAADIAGGAYTVPSSKKLSPGKYRVAITGERPAGRKIETDPGSGQYVQNREQYIPPRYNAQTELTADITGDAEGVNFDLELPKRR